MDRTLLDDDDATIAWLAGLEDDEGPGYQPTVDPAPPAPAWPVRRRRREAIRLRRLAHPLTDPMTNVLDGRMHTTAALLAAGHTFDRLLRLERDGALVRVHDEVWMSMVGMLATGNGISMAAEVLLRPGVVCLLTACEWHGVSDEDPWETWTSATKSVPSIPWDEINLTVGVEVVEIAGVAVRITGAARTVVDMLRARGDLGDEPARAALMDWRERGTDKDLLAVARQLGCEEQVRWDLDNVPPIWMTWS